MSIAPDGNQTEAVDSNLATPEMWAAKTRSTTPHNTLLLFAKGFLADGALVDLTFEEK